MKRRRIDPQLTPATDPGSKSDDTVTTRPANSAAVGLAREVRRRFQTPPTGGRGRDPGWTTKRLMPLRPEALTRLQELARAVSQIVSYRVEPLQVAALIVERDLALWGDQEDLGGVGARRDVVDRTAASNRSTRRRSADSDRLMRVARLAVEILGSREKAIGWLHEPNRALEDDTPLAHLDTVRGARQVEALLARLAQSS